MRTTYESGPDCRVCGYKAINVLHEQDPRNAPEGFDYYKPFLHDLHEFEASDGDAPIVTGDYQLDQLIRALGERNIYSRGDLETYEEIIRREAVARA